MVFLAVYVDDVEACQRLVSPNRRVPLKFVKSKLFPCEFNVSSITGKEKQ
jgi:hypothetical protein